MIELGSISNFKFTKLDNSNDTNNNAIRHLLNKYQKYKVFYILFFYDFLYLIFSNKLLIFINIIAFMF